MRRIILVAVALAALLAACGAGSGTIVEPTVAGYPSGGITPPLQPAGTSPLVEPYPGYSGDGYPAPATEPPAGYPEGPMQTPNKPEQAGAPQLSVLLEAVKLHLSEQTGVPATSMTVVSMDAETWPDAGLGCPEEGMAYAQVLVEGARIILDAGGQQYDYHTAGTGSFVLCQDGRPVSQGVVPQRK